MRDIKAERDVSVVCQPGNHHPFQSAVPTQAGTHSLSLAQTQLDPILPPRLANKLPMH